MKPWIKLVLIKLSISITITDNHLFSQNCPLEIEYHKFNKGWIIGDTIYEYSTEIFRTKIEKKGSGIIFKYTARYNCPESHDEEMTDYLLWSIPDSLTSFKIALTKDSFGTQDFIYRLNLIPPNMPKNMRTCSGEISGYKEGDNWNISASLTVIVNWYAGETLSRNISFSKTFTQTIYKGPKKRKKAVTFNTPFYEYY